MHNSKYAPDENFVGIFALAERLLVRFPDPLADGKSGGDPV